MAETAMVEKEDLLRQKRSNLETPFLSSRIKYVKLQRIYRITFYFVPDGNPNETELPSFVLLTYE